MKTMYKFFTVLICTSLAFACSKKENEGDDPVRPVEGLVFTAVSTPSHSDPTKTELDGTATNGVLWQEGDKIQINGVIYKTEEGGSTRAVFEKYDTKNDPRAPYVGFYPSGYFDHNDSLVHMPSIITYKAGSMAGFPMAAYSTSTILPFHNAAGCVHLVVKGSGTLRKLVISDAMMGISGYAKMLKYTTSTPSFEMVDTVSTNTLTITFSGGTALTSSGVDIYIPFSFENFMELNFFFDIDDNPTLLSMQQRLIYFDPGVMEKIECTIKSPLLGGKFSVSPEKQVRFAKGNLIYDCTSMKWGHFNRQYGVCATMLRDTTKTANLNVITHHTWGYHPTQSIDPTGSTSDNITIGGGENWDESTQGWGSHVGDGNWRTLNSEEWNYLLGFSNDCRDYASSKWGRARIDLQGTGLTIVGIVILPDYFEDPFEGTGKAFKPYKSSGGATNDYSGNAPGVTPTVRSWDLMEEAGAVFLPESNCRTGAKFSGGLENFWLHYWTSTASTSQDQAVALGEEYYHVFNWEALDKGFGASVRLVKDIE